MRKCEIGIDVSGGTAKVYEIRRLFMHVYYRLRRRKDDPVGRDRKKDMFPLLSPFIEVQLSSEMPPASETEEEMTYRELPRTKRRTRPPMGTTKERESTLRPRFEAPSSRDATKRADATERPRRTLRERRERPPGFDTIPLPPPPPPPLSTISQLFATVFVPPSKTDARH